MQFIGSTASRVWTPCLLEYEEIQRRTPETQLARVILIFQWVTVARKPLTFTALRAGLAVQKDRHATASDYIQDFEKVLPQICGSLVEVREDKAVCFIHVSVAEFLTHERSSPHAMLHPFHITLPASEASMAELGLRYLTNDVPGLPLTSSGTIAPQ